MGLKAGVIEPVKAILRQVESERDRAIFGKAGSATGLFLTYSAIVVEEVLGWRVVSICRLVFRTMTQFHAQSCR